MVTRYSDYHWYHKSVSDIERCVPTKGLFPKENDHIRVSFVPQVLSANSILPRMQVQAPIYETAHFLE